MIHLAISWTLMPFICFCCCISFIKAISHLGSCISVILPSLKILINVWNFSSLLNKTLIDWLSLGCGQGEALVDGAHSDTAIFLDCCWRWVACILNTREPVSSTGSSLLENLHFYYHPTCLCVFWAAVWIRRVAHLQRDFSCSKV